METSAHISRLGCYGISGMFRLSIEKFKSVFVLSSIDQLLRLRGHLLGRQDRDDEESFLCFLTDREKKSHEPIREYDLNANERSNHLIS